MTDRKVTITADHTRSIIEGLRGNIPLLSAHISGHGFTDVPLPATSITLAPEKVTVVLEFVAGDPRWSVDIVGGTQ